MTKADQFVKKSTKIKHFQAKKPAAETQKSNKTKDSRETSLKSLKSSKKHMFHVEQWSDGCVFHVKQKPLKSAQKQPKTAIFDGF